MNVKVIKMENLTIGQIAKQAAVGVETMRFYERKGLIKKPKRNVSGYRQYPLEAVSQIRFIKRAQEVGFSLAEIKALLLLRLDSSKKCEDVKARALAKINEIKGKVKDLNRMKNALLDLTKACDTSSDIDQCPILKAFDDGL
ncbi:MAG: MerR family DNA-binding protein [Planctomycetes bacterium]|nr:MerR family DNA-binding protein [Planctomycetota bacterium]